MGEIEDGRVSFPGIRFVDFVQKELLLARGDLLFNRTNSLALVGKVGLIESSVENITFASYLIRLRVSKGNSSKFYWYLLNSENFLSYSRSNAIQTANQANLSSSKLKQFKTVSIPLSTQKAIAHYLDTKTAQIDRQIDLLTQKAQRYEELKRAIVNETVTRGLDKSVPMKDSGIKWLGEIPEHWELDRLKNLAKINTGSKDTNNNIENGLYPFFVRSQTIERINSYSFNGEAILTAGDGVGVGKVFHYFEGKFDYHQRVYKISHFRNLIGRFLFFYMKNHFYKEALRLNAKATVDSLRMPMFENFPVAFGSREEQSEIVDYLDTKTAQIDQIIQTINTQIEKLQELRKTLINDVVTGKIKVI